MESNPQSEILRTRRPGLLLARSCCVGRAGRAGRGGVSFVFYARLLRAPLKQSTFVPTKTRRRHRASATGANTHAKQKVENKWHWTGDVPRPF